MTSSAISTRRSSKKVALVPQFSLHSTTSPNGVRLIDFAAARSMVVCSTVIQAWTRTTSLSQPRCECAYVYCKQCPLARRESWTSKSCDHNGRLSHFPLNSQTSPTTLVYNGPTFPHSLRASAEAVVGFERPPQRNQ